MWMHSALLLLPTYVVRWEGNSFTLFVCPHRGGRGGPGTPPGGYLTGYTPGGSGYPPGGYLTGYPPGGLGTPPGSGYPPGGTWLGTPRGGLGTPPGGYLTGYPPGVWVPPPPRGGYPGRTTEGVLTTRRAVCLLRSRRRTFLFVQNFASIDAWIVFVHCCPWKKFLWGK